MPYTREYPSAEYLLSTFAYSDTLGSPLTWKAPRPKIVVGQAAGGIASNGYWVVKLDGKTLRVSRVVWLMHKGTLSTELQVDHRNGDKNDNRIENLCAKTVGQNQENQVQPRGKNPYLGVNQNKNSGKWVSAIQSGGRRTHLGTFNTPEEAYEAYLEAKAANHTGAEMWRFAG